MYGSWVVLLADPSYVLQNMMREGGIAAGQPVPAEVVTMLGHACELLVAHLARGALASVAVAASANPSVEYEHVAAFVGASKNLTFLQGSV